MNCLYCPALLPPDNLCKHHVNLVRFICGPQGGLLETQIYLTDKMPHQYVALSHYIGELAIYTYDPVMRLTYYLDYIPEGITPDNTRQFMQRLFDLKAFL